MEDCILHYIIYPNLVTVFRLRFALRNLFYLHQKLRSVCPAFGLQLAFERKREGMDPESLECPLHPSLSNGPLALCLISSQFLRQSRSTSES